MTKVTAIAYTGYPVTDLARARAFYENALGLKPVTVWEGDGRGWIEYELGEGCLAITNGAAEGWKASSEGPMVVLEVSDLAAMAASLRAAGVKFKVGPMEFPPCHLATVLDPDGNQVGLHQRKASA